MAPMVWGKFQNQGRAGLRGKAAEFKRGKGFASFRLEKVPYKDYKTLEHDTWLNDIIIDFFLAWLYREVLEEEARPRVHIFTTMFYRCRPLV